MQERKKYYPKSYHPRIFDIFPLYYLIPKKFLSAWLDLEDASLIEAIAKTREEFERVPIPQGVRISSNNLDLCGLDAIITGLNKIGIEVNPNGGIELSVNEAAALIKANLPGSK